MAPTGCHMVSTHHMIAGGRGFDGQCVARPVAAAVLVVQRQCGEGCGDKSHMAHGADAAGVSTLKTPAVVTNQ